jgi:hypothetical protein
MKKIAIVFFFLFSLLFFYFLWIFTAQAPKKEVAVYKGIWFPVLSIVPVAHPVSFNLNKLKDVGVNTVSFPVAYFVDKEGNIFTFFWVKPITKFQIKRLHKHGFKVMLTNLVLEKFKGPSPLPSEILEKQIFWENLEKIVIKNAKLAQDYKVEIYAPLNEPESLFQKKPEKAWEWAREILPQIKGVYHGKVAWKGDFSAQLENENFDFEKANFRGYDILGFSICLRMEPEKYGDYVSKVIKTMKEINARSNTLLFVSEFGAWEKPWNENPQNVKFAYEKVLQLARENNLKGFFALEESFASKNPFSVFESVLKKYYANSN